MRANSDASSLRYREGNSQYLNVKIANLHLNLKGIHRFLHNTHFQLGNNKISRHDHLEIALPE